MADKPHLKEEALTHTVVIETVDNGWVVTLEYLAESQEDIQLVFNRSTSLRLWLNNHFEKQVLALPEDPT